MERSRDGQDSSNLELVPVEKRDELQFSQEEASELSGSLAFLSGKQFKAVRLEAAGLDCVTIAGSVGVSADTIKRWRKDPFYIKARTIFISIINKQGLRFRLDCQKQILAPVYAELMKRTSNPRYLRALETKELLDVLKIVGKETRLDAMVGGVSSSEDDDLKELQMRRENFSKAEQAQAVNEIIKHDKIIQFPSTGTDGQQ